MVAVTGNADGSSELDYTVNAATGLPLTVFVDAEGRELARLEGIAEWDHPDVIAYFSAFTN